MTPDGETGADHSPVYKREWRPSWVKTPWWVFWRPKWRCEKRYSRYHTFEGYQYADDQQLARIGLEDEFGKS